MPNTLRSLPKAELHVHLEGSFTPPVPAEELAARWSYSTFAGFIDAFKWTVGFLQTPADYAAATRQLIASLAAQGVVYAEITLAAGVVLWKGLDLEEVFAAVNAEAKAAPFPVYWIVDCIRQHGGAWAIPIAHFAARHATNGIVGFGIGGDESSTPAAEFRPAIDAARVPFVPHAGETTNARNIWDMLLLGARRIGHGIRAIEDPDLMAYLAQHDIPLEISITSNIRTGAIASLDDHPIARLAAAGVPIVLNTDDPAIFNTTLLAEYELAATRFGLDPAALAAASLRYGFQRAR